MDFTKRRFDAPAAGYTAEDIKLFIAVVEEVAAEAKKRTLPIPAETDILQLLFAAAEDGERDVKKLAAAVLELAKGRPAPKPSAGATIIERSSSLKRLAAIGITAAGALQAHIIASTSFM